MRSASSNTDQSITSRSVKAPPNFLFPPRVLETEAVTVTVEFTTPCVTQIVTVCDPGNSLVILRLKVMSES